MKFSLAAVAFALACAAGPAWADPDVHRVPTPDGGQIVTITDSNSQLVAPSTSLRVVLQCSPEPVRCVVVEHNTRSANLLEGLFRNALFGLVLRPDETNIANGNSNSAGASAQQGQVQGQIAVSSSTAVAGASAAGGAGGSGGNGEGGAGGSGGQGGSGGSSNGDNGHGNDEDGDDDSNPGNGGPHGN